MEKYYADLPALEEFFQSRHMRRVPDFTIGPETDPYMLRWWVIPRNHFLNVYLHEIHRSDDERALHDHPWDNTSLIIRGHYIEVTPEGEFPRKPGDIITRKATDAHRLVISGQDPVLSLFITGPMIREWGFHCPDGWRHWKVFTELAADGKSSLRGKGCEE